MFDFVRFDFFGNCANNEITRKSFVQTVRINHLRKTRTICNKLSAGDKAMQKQKKE